MKGHVVHIVESSSALNLLDRRQDGAALQGNLRQMGVSSERYLVVTEAMLAEAIRRIAASHEEDNAYAEHAPMLHVSCDSTEDGITLTSGEHIAWTEFGELITPINSAASGALLVGMSTCHGYNALEVAKTLSGDLPFGVLVGPVAAVDWHDSLVASTVLYHRFTKFTPTTVQELESIVTAMQDAAGVPRGMFRFAIGHDVQDELADRFARTLDDQDRQRRMRTSGAALQELMVRRAARAQVRPWTGPRPV